MPELPDITVYLDALERFVVGRTLQRIELHSPFVLRSVEPPIASVHEHVVRGVRRVGKRIALEFDDDLFLVVHLMIAGRLRWRAPGKKPGMGPRMMLASFVFEHGTLFFTEASSTKRASLQLVRGGEALAAMNPGGIEPLAASLEEFHEALTRESHTVKRALTDPHLFSGIGNAYSDEILHAAKLSPLKLTRTLTDAEFLRLYDATRETLNAWIERLRADASAGFPEKVTAFHDQMAAHGRYGKPCPVCGTPIQRIVYKDNECNYCPTCQTGGKLLADRALSRLLGQDWPRSLDEL